MMLYLKLIWVFFQIGVLSFGGGYAAMPIVEDHVVEQLEWMSAEEFADVIIIDELTPGPIALNTSTFVGTKMAGLGGAVAATLGNIVPSCILAFILAKLYYKYRTLKLINGALSGLRAMAVALLASMSLTLIMTALFGGMRLPLALSDTDFLAAVLFAGSLFVLRKWKLNPLLILLICGVVGLIGYPLLGC